MEISSEERHTVVLDDRLHIRGVNHFSENALEDLFSWLEEYSPTPDMIAVEDYPEKFAPTVQLRMARGESLGVSESGICLAYCLTHSTPLSLIDSNWADAEFKSGTDYQSIIDEAYEEAGVREPSYLDAHYTDFVETNDAIAEYDPEFYRQFIAERDLSMAAHLVGLLHETDYDTVFAVMGIGHVNNVVETMQEIADGKATTKPQSPPIYSPKELCDIVLDDEAVLEEIPEQVRSAFNKGTVASLRKQYQKRAQEHLGSDL